MALRACANQKGKMPQFSRPTRWVTHVHRDAWSSLARDRRAIGVHFAQCQAGRGRWFGVFCVGEALNRVLAPRLFTLVASAAAVFAAISAFA